MVWRVCFEEVNLVVNTRLDFVVSWFMEFNDEQLRRVQVETIPDEQFMQERGFLPG